MSFQGRVFEIALFPVHFRLSVRSSTLQSINDNIIYQFEQVNPDHLLKKRSISGTDHDKLLIHNNINTFLKAENGLTGKKRALFLPVRQIPPAYAICGHIL
jgi:hypothetical protein